MKLDLRLQLARGEVRHADSRAATGSTARSRAALRTCWWLIGLGVADLNRVSTSFWRMNDETDDTKRSHRSLNSRLTIAPGSPPGTPSVIAAKLLPLLLVQPVGRLPPVAVELLAGIARADRQHALLELLDDPVDDLEDLELLEHCRDDHRPHRADILGNDILVEDRLEIGQVDAEIGDLVLSAHILDVVEHLVDAAPKLRLVGADLARGKTVA